jgi:endonuclease YncB( thermonuclease family)
MKQPPEGFTTKANVSRVIDGDTVDVTITRKIRVRLKDCWAPETRTRDSNERQKGIASKKHLEKLLRKNKHVVLHIPADKEGDIKDIFTFGRVVGYIFVDEQDVSSEMVSVGHATRKKHRDR